MINNDIHAYVLPHALSKPLKDTVFMTINDKTVLLTCAQATSLIKELNDALKELNAKKD